MTVWREAYFPLLRVSVVILCALIFAWPARADDNDALFRSIYRELVEINTTESAGDTHRAAEAMAARLRAGGFSGDEVQVFQVGPHKGDLVARLKGTGAQKPVLLMAHIDVVEAPPAGWDTPPFTLVEKDGVFHARGSIDDKAMAAIFVTNLIRYRTEKFVPDRDLVLALTTDEELSDSPDDGARFLVEKHRDLIDAAFALNEGGGGTLKDGKPARMTIQLAEKVYLSFKLDVKDRGGHSAGPRPDQAIDVLAAGLTRLAAFNFPPHLNDVTRTYFERIAPTEEPAVRAAIEALLAGKTDDATLAPLTRNVGYNATLRTTCTPTLISGGQAENALPQDASATINCRILPDQPTGEVAATVARVLAEPRITVTQIGKPVLSPPSPLDPALMRAVEGIMGEMWPGVPLIPTMSGGYTDMRWIRSAGIPAYGLSGLFVEFDKTGVHGLNEQVPVKSLEDSRQFLYRLVKALASKPTGQP